MQGMLRNGFQLCRIDEGYFNTPHQSNTHGVSEGTLAQ